MQQVQLVPEATPSPEDNRILEYLRTDDADTLEQIIRDNAHFVRVIVSRLPNPAPNVLSLDDLYQCGMMGLLSAVARFDPGRGVSFRTWAFPRIQGAARDAIRQASSNSRLRGVTYVPLDSISAAALESIEGDQLSLLPTRSSQQLLRAFEALPIRQSLVVLLAANGFTTGRIAIVLGISPSRVMQDKRNALLRVRTSLLSELE